MVSRRSRVGALKKMTREDEIDDDEEEEEESDGKRAHYEESRAQRIKENSERMKSLGIFDLSMALKSKPSSSSLRKSKPVSSSDPPRRSSRLKDMPRVSYSEKKMPNSKIDKSVENVEINIPPGEKPEIYTEEHQKLLGDSSSVWELYVDGYDEDGQRIYDPVNGKTCHQCRQKTTGLHTECSICQKVTGQFCGDCLYMRYGENVTEVNQNPDWVCPVCRDICNCSRCRRQKGWTPTGAIYKKVAKLGFKSVAHYLIHTVREQAGEEASFDENGVLIAEPNAVDDGKEASSAAHSAPPLEGEEKESDEDYMQSDSDDGNDDSKNENASS
ncbi:uncharacterized protein LOC127258324 [Andrographis paniculata]|uniref:uncharacterized protein LOC127258324 n=1 Tax=Andrographis paniculata TaxID=175694 RepID=UPI0021E7E803|nr:uncharacterized protein LOC127258324 [Andrographis paniculata]